MKKSSSTVSIHPSTNISKGDSRINLSLLQIANGAIQNRLNFLNFFQKINVIVKSLQLIKSKVKKYRAIVNNLYKELKVNNLMKLRFSIDESEVSKLPLF